MPDFEINTANQVLIKLPMGKSFVDNPNLSRDQSRQKGDTCWYYAFNYLRPRYGKQIDRLVALVEKDLPELTQNLDFQALKKGREIEKKISAFRKLRSKIAVTTVSSLSEEQKNHANNHFSNDITKAIRELVKDIGTNLDSFDKMME